MDILAMHMPLDTQRMLRTNSLRIMIVSVACAAGLVAQDSPAQARQAAMTLRLPIRAVARTRRNARSLTIRLRLLRA